MPRDWKGPFNRRLQVRASEHGKKMAAERWRLDKEHRDKLSLLNPIQYPGKILRRIIVIDNEVNVKEAIMYDTDSMREARRKLKQVLYK